MIITPRWLIQMGKRDALGFEYSLPQNILRKYQYADIGNLMLRGYLDFRSDLFVYLYERKPDN